MENWLACLLRASSALEGGNVVVDNEGPDWLDRTRPDGAGARVGSGGSVWDGVKRTTKASTKGSLVTKKVKRKTPLEKSMLIIEKWHNGYEVSTANLEGPQPCVHPVQLFTLFAEALGQIASGSVLIGVCLPPLETSH